MLRLVHAAALAAALGCLACSLAPPRPSLPPFVEEADVPADRALLVVYRDSRRYGSFNPMPVSSFGTVIAQLPAGAAVQCLVFPGRRSVEATMLGAKGPVRRGSVSLELLPGQRYFLKAVPSMGLAAVEVGIAPVEPGLARAELAGCGAVLGPAGGRVLSERGGPAAPGRGDGPALPGAGRTDAAPAAGQAVAANVPTKIAALLRSGSPVSLLVVVPEADLRRDYAGEAPVPASWKKEKAAELAAEWAGQSLEAFGGHPGFSVVNREGLGDILAEFELQGSAAFDQRSTARFGRMAGASHMLLLSFAWRREPGGPYLEDTTVKLVDLALNTILAVDRIRVVISVEESTGRATVLERWQNGVRLR